LKLLKGKRLEPVIVPGRIKRGGRAGTWCLKRHSVAAQALLPGALSPEHFCRVCVRVSGGRDRMVGPRCPVAFTVTGVIRSCRYPSHPTEAPQQRGKPGPQGWVGAALVVGDRWDSLLCCLDSRPPAAAQSASWLVILTKCGKSSSLKPVSHWGHRIVA